MDVGARGRPQGTGRALTLAQEAELALLALYGAPEAAGQPGDAVVGRRRARRARSGASVSRSAPARRRALPGTLGPDAGRAARRGRALARQAACNGSSPNPHQAAARRTARTRTWWCGGLPAPASGRGRHSARGLLVAVDARGQIAWLPVASLSLQDAYIDFLAPPAGAGLRNPSSRGCTAWPWAAPRSSTTGSRRSRACSVARLPDRAGAPRAAGRRDRLPRTPPPLATDPFPPITATARRRPCPGLVARSVRPALHHSPKRRQRTIP